MGYFSAARRFIVCAGENPGNRKSRQDVAAAAGCNKAYRSASAKGKIRIERTMPHDSAKND